MKIQRLSAEKKAEIERLRADMFQKFRDVPEGGRDVDYLGLQFTVLPTLFWPHDDSKPLVENYVINPGEDVLDVCTGSGNIAMMSALKGAGRVVALDKNPYSPKAVRTNANRHNVGQIVEARQSDMFSAIKPGEKFDVITGNLPFEMHPAVDGAENNVYDPCFHANYELFTKAGELLRPGGRVYFSQSNFGSIDDALGLAWENGMFTRMIGERDMQDGLRIFYAFEGRFLDE